MLVPSCVLLQDKSSTSNLKIEALIFTRLVLASHSPPVFHPHIEVSAVTLNFFLLPSVEDIIYFSVLPSLLLGKMRHVFLK